MSHKLLTDNKNTEQKQPDDMLSLVEQKINFFKDIIQKTIIHVQKNKKLDILGINEINICIEKLSELSKNLEEIITLSSTKTTISIKLTKLQKA